MVKSRGLCFNGDRSLFCMDFVRLAAISHTALTLSNDVISAWKRILSCQALTSDSNSCYYRRFSGYGRRMSSVSMNSFVIDAFSFARGAERREGQIAVADMPRLLADCADSSGQINWTLVGGNHQMDVPQLALQISGQVQLMCQRCLHSFAFEVASSSVLILAKDDDQADELEAMLDDESLDVILASQTFNLFELIEDEALLALPLSPRHEVCPDASLLEKVQNDKELPFATLKGLQQ